MGWLVSTNITGITRAITAWHGISMSGCSWWWILWRAPWFGPSHQRFLSLLRNGSCILGVAYSWSDKTRLNIEHVKPFIHLHIICWRKKCSIILACFTALLSVNWPITSTGLNFKHHVSRFWDDTVQWINQVHWSGVGVSGWVLNHVNHHYFLPSLAALQPSLSCITIPTIVIIILLKSIRMLICCHICLYSLQNFYRYSPYDVICRKL